MILFLTRYLCFEPTRTRSKQTSIAHFVIVAKDDLSYLGIVTSQQRVTLAFLLHSCQSFQQIGTKDIQQWIIYVNTDFSSASIRTATVYANILLNPCHFTLILP